MTVAYCANRKIYPQLPTTLNSLITNNPDIGKIYLLIEDDELETVRHPKITFININQFDFLIRDGFNCTKKFPYTAMVRCFFTKILKEDKILYLDVDTVVDGDLSELWKFPLGSNCVAARSEQPEQSDRVLPVGYFNSGVLLMNLKLIKGLHYDDAMIRLLKQCKFQFPDQDAMNVVFKRSVQYLPDKYNVLGGDEVYNYDVTIRHYAGLIKPWKEQATEADKAFWNKYYTKELIY